MKLNKSFYWLIFFSAAIFAAFEYSDYLNALCTRESQCNPGSKNQYGFIGSYQMGEAALIDAGYYTSDGTQANDWTGQWTGKNGIHRLADFYANPSVQTQAITDYNLKQWGYITGKGLQNYIGQTVAGVLITESGLLAGAHLVGAGGLSKFLSSNGNEVPHDGNKVAVTNYIKKFSGYNLAPISGNTTVGGTGNAGFVGPIDPYIDSGGTYYGSSTGNGTYTPVAPLEAFKTGTGGVTSGTVSTSIQSITALILLLWLSFVSWGQLKLWTSGEVSIMNLQTTIIKASVMVMFLIWILLN